MTFEEAKEALLFHSAGHPDFEDARWENGFLGSLRPYRGLNEDNFYEVMEAVKGVSSHLQNDEAIDKTVMGSLWDLCLIARAWGVEPDGMLRGNNLILDEDSARLAMWIETISWTVSFLMAGNDWQEALQNGNMHNLDLSRLK